MAATESYIRNQLHRVPLSDLQPDPEQPRKYMDPAGLAELAASISQVGVVVPILFRQEGDGLLYVVAGERRCLAARRAGLTEIPGICIDGQNHAEIALVENILRQDLNPIEEAEAFDRLIKGKSYTQEDLANILGKTQSLISATLSLNRLPQEIRDECRSDATIPKRVLIEIARAKQTRAMVTRYREYRRKQVAQETKQGGQAATLKRNAEEQLLAAVASLTARIGKTDLTLWPGDQVSSLKTALRDLNVVAEDRFVAFAAAAQEPIEAGPRPSAQE